MYINTRQDNITLSALAKSMGIRLSQDEQDGMEGSVLLWLDLRL